MGTASERLKEKTGTTERESVRWWGKRGARTGRKSEREGGRGVDGRQRKRELRVGVGRGRRAKKQGELGWERKRWK